MWRTGHHVAAVTTKEITAVTLTWKERKPSTPGFTVHHQPSFMIRELLFFYFSVLVKEVSLHLPTFYIRDSLTFPELFWDCIEFTCVRHVDREEQSELLYL